MTNYLFTIRLEYLDTPCINKSFVCTFSQFKKEFSMFYPEIDYTIPKEILDKIGDQTKVGDQCLVIPLGPITSVSQAVWICHESPQKLFKMQKLISEYVTETYKKNFEMEMVYVQNESVVHKGKLYLTPEDWTFKKGEEAIVAANWIDTQPYATGMYMKDQIKWKGNGTKPEDERCVKLFRKKEVINKNPDIFCVYLSQDDMADEITQNKLKNNNTIDAQELKLKEIAKSRFAAQIYTNKINVRLQNATERDALNKMMNLPKSTLNIDSEILNPVKAKVRDEYLKNRHELLNDEPTKLLTPVQIANELDKLKKKNIKEVCRNIDICINAMNYSVDKGLLPLSGEREKFAMDKENPFNNIAPKIPIQINLPDKDSIGKKAVDEVAKLKGAKEYFAEKIPEGKGPIPTHDDIKKAFNTIQNLKENKKYEKLDDINKGCKANERNNITNIRRRISFLMYSGDNDIFFEYLGYIKNYQFAK